MLLLINISSKLKYEGEVTKMNFSIDNSLLDDLYDRIMLLKTGLGQVSENELFNEEFMIKYSPYDSIWDLLDDGFMGSLEAFLDLPKSQRDKYISEKTNFETWEDLFFAASRSYLLKKIVY